MPDEQPIDAFDPRFPDRGTEQDDVDRKRNLVQSRGPGPNPDDPKVRILRLAIPALAAAAILVIGAVFFQGLQPSGATAVFAPKMPPSIDDFTVADWYVPATGAGAAPKIPPWMDEAVVLVVVGGGGASGAAKTEER